MKTSPLTLFATFLSVFSLAAALSPSLAHASGSHFSCSMSAEKNYKPDASKPDAKEIQSLVDQDLAKLKSKGRVTYQNEKNKKRCGGGDGKGKRERASLSKLRAKKVPLACYCKEDKSDFATAKPVFAPQTMSQIGAGFQPSTATPNQTAQGLGDPLANKTASMPGNPALSQSVTDPNDRVPSSTAPATFTTPIAGSNTIVPANGFTPSAPAPAPAAPAKSWFSSLF